MLMEALNVSIRGKQVSWRTEIPQADWQAFFSLSRQQHILPLVLNGIYRCEAYLKLPEPLRRQLKQDAARQVVGQTLRTEALKRLTEDARKNHLPFLTMKGIGCRVLYPMPDARPSSDEDLLVPDAQFAAWVDFLLISGYHPLKETYDVDRDFEIGFRTADAYIELHRSPFAPDSDVLNGFNSFFALAHERAMNLPVEGAVIPAMGPYDHMLYLILHAFKHLIHSGFGLRQICDIVLWAERYGSEIDWDQLKAQCDSVRYWGFAATVFEIGRRYFELDLEAAHIPAELLQGDFPCEALLADLLSGGVYGGTSLSRKHSSTITLQAVESARGGKRSSLLQTLFPARSRLMGTYPYLKRWPVLLPAAWFQRIAKYGIETANRNAVSRPSESIRIGNERMELLRQLDILD